MKSCAVVLGFRVHLGSSGQQCFDHSGVTGPGRRMQCDGAKFVGHVQVDAAVEQHQHGLRVSGECRQMAQRTAVLWISFQKPTIFLINFLSLKVQIWQCQKNFIFAMNFWNCNRTLVRSRIESGKATINASVIFCWPRSMASWIGVLSN